MADIDTLTLRLNSLETSYSQQLIEIRNKLSNYDNYFANVGISQMNQDKDIIKLQADSKAQAIALNLLLEQQKSLKAGIDALLVQAQPNKQSLTVGEAWYKS